MGMNWLENVEKLVKMGKKWLKWVKIGQKWSKNGGNG
jgi:hypothetical protein